MFTAAEVMDRAALLMNDMNKLTYTYSVQLPYVKMAWDRLRKIVSLVDQPVFNEVSVPTLYAANATIIDKPANMLIPIEVLERDETSTDEGAWMKLAERVWEPLAEPTDVLGYWSWREQQLTVRPCRRNRSVLVKYIKDMSGDISTQNSNVTIDDTLNFLSFKTAEFLARYLAHNSERANELAGDAGEEQFIIENEITKKQQFRSVRRKPYSMKKKLIV